MADYHVENHGSLFLVRPSTEEAEKHLLEVTGDEAQFMGNAVAVEPRYIESFAYQLIEDGFTVE